MNDKRCGTCRWFEPDEDNDQRGRCAYPLPVWMRLNDFAFRDSMLATAGTTCPTWAEPQP